MNTYNCVIAELFQSANTGYSLEKHEWTKIERHI